MQVLFNFKFTQATWVGAYVHTCFHDKRSSARVCYSKGFKVIRNIGSCYIQKLQFKQFLRLFLVGAALHVLQLNWSCHLSLDTCYRSLLALGFSINSRASANSLRVLSERRAPAASIRTSERLSRQGGQRRILKSQTWIYTACVEAWSAQKTTWMELMTATFFREKTVPLSTTVEFHV